MPPSRLALLLLCILLPLPGLAQASDAGAQPAPSVTPPPLVPAPSEPPDSPQPGSGDSGAAPDAPRGEIIPREWYEEEEPSPAAPRILLEFLGGTVGGTLGIIPGGLLMLTGLCFDSCDDGAETRAILGLGVAFTGFVAGMAYGINAAGDFMGGNGGFWPAAGGVVLGMLGGLLAGIPILASDEEAGIIPILTGPIVGGILGYELSRSSSDSRRIASTTPRPQVVPLIATSPRGGIIGGLAGRF